MCWKFPLTRSRCKKLFFFLFDYLSRHIELIKITITGGHKQNTKQHYFISNTHPFTARNHSFPSLHLSLGNPLMSFFTPSFLLLLLICAHHSTHLSGEPVLAGKLVFEFLKHLGKLSLKVVDAIGVWWISRYRKSSLFNCARWTRILLLRSTSNQERKVVWINFTKENIVSSFGYIYIYFCNNHEKYQNERSDIFGNKVSTKRKHFWLTSCYEKFGKTVFIFKIFDGFVS